MYAPHACPAACDEDTAQGGLMKCVRDRLLAQSIVGRFIVGGAYSAPPPRSAAKSSVGAPRRYVVEPRAVFRNHPMHPANHPTCTTCLEQKSARPRWSARTRLRLRLHGRVNDNHAASEQHRNYQTLRTRQGLPGTNTCPLANPNITT